jgi:hypothetical protein
VPAFTVPLAGFRLAGTDGTHLTSQEASDQTKCRAGAHPTDVRHIHRSDDRRLHVGAEASPIVQEHDRITPGADLPRVTYIKPSTVGAKCISRHDTSGPSRRMPMRSAQYIPDVSSRIASMSA